MEESRLIIGNSRKQHKMAIIGTSVVISIMLISYSITQDPEYSYSMILICGIIIVLITLAFETFRIELGQNKLYVFPQFNRFKKVKEIPLQEVSYIEFYDNDWFEGTESMIYIYFRPSFKKKRIKVSMTQFELKDILELIDKLRHKVKVVVNSDIIKKGIKKKIEMEKSYEDNKNSDV